MGDPILSQKRIDELESQGIDNVFLNSISFWEIFIKVHKGKLILGESAKSFSEKIIRSGKVNVFDSNWEDFLLASSLNWRHPDPIDRILVASAKRRNWKFLSKDQEIKKYFRDTYW